MRKIRVISNGVYLVKFTPTYCVLMLVLSQYVRDVDFATNADDGSKTPLSFLQMINNMFLRTFVRSFSVSITEWDL